MSKEFKVGLLAVVAGILLYFGFNYLKGIDFFSNTNKYYISYDHISGLTVSNNVIVKGLAVGRVSAIRLDQNGTSDRIIVEIDVDNSVTVGEGAIAELANSDILGGKAIQLQPGDINKPLQPGDTLKGQIDERIEQILAQTGDVADNIAITIGGINKILKDMEGSGSEIKQSITELKKTLGNINEFYNTNARTLELTIKETRATVSHLKESVSGIKPITDKTNKFLDSLNQLQIQKTLDNINDLTTKLSETASHFKDNEGTLGKLMTEDSLYNNLNQLLIDLDKTVNHFNEHPRDFLKPLGRKNKKLKGNK